MQIAKPKLAFYILRQNVTTLLKEKNKEMSTEILIADMSKLIFIHKTFWGYLHDLGISTICI